MLGGINEERKDLGIPYYSPEGRKELFFLIVRGEDLVKYKLCTMFISQSAASGESLQSVDS